MPIKLQKEAEQYFTSRKLLSYDEAVKKASQLKKEGKKTGLCHGGFDLLHPGHIKHFESAKALCDALFVSVTSDRFVASRKGAGRPVIPEKLRAYSIAALESVDYAFVSDLERAVQVIKDLKPSAYIKGSDFINKDTPGINGERQAILSAGGGMEYTRDYKLSTSDIIRYVKQEVGKASVLLVLDRDGTLVEDAEFLGRNKDWRKEVRLNEAVADLILHAQARYDATSIVVSNQSGVARGYFTPQTVEKVNEHISTLLSERGILIDDWQYCPDADAAYAKTKGKGKFDPKFVKETTERKPSTAMVCCSLKRLNKNMGEFSRVVVIGDSEDDQILAQRLGAGFIGVKGKNYGQMLKEMSAIAG